MLCIVHRKGFIRNRIDKDAFSNTDTPVRPPVSITSLYFFLSHFKFLPLLLQSFDNSRLKFSKNYSYRD